jgi:CcmD family protein
MTWGRVGALAIVVLALGMALGPTVAEAGLQPQPALDEFVPMDQVPPEDQLPAAPLLIAAYSLVWVCVFGYLWSIWRRMATVEREIAELSRRLSDR